VSSSFSEQDVDPLEDMGGLLDSVEIIKPLRRGDVVDGQIMRVDADGILVHIGHKAEGIVPPGEMRSLSGERLKALKVGEAIVTLVIRPETAEEPALLSVDKAVAEKGWHVLEKAMQSKESIQGRILGFNRGGAIVEVEGIQGFVPMSQLMSVAREPKQTPAGEQVADGGGKRQPARGGDVGKLVQLKVLEVNRGRNRAIFSERQAMQAWREEQKARLIQELKEGEVRRGKVTGISNFGAFVDLGGADGLIHISELSWSPINSPEEIVKVGDEIDVRVLKVDADNKKISLSLRRMQPEPWETIHQRYQVGDIVNAKVTKLTDFGAFARVEGAIEGLIHISELTSRNIAHPREVVSEGDVVRLKILRIEPERRRLGLSLKQALEDSP
jgi:small subunit ribosomal protein S1